MWIVALLHIPLVPLAERLVQPGGTEQDVQQAEADLVGVERLGAHAAVGLKCADDSAHQFLGQVRRVGELLLAVVRGLLAEYVGFHQLGFDVVHVHQLVVVAQLALEEVVDLGDDLGQPGLVGVALDAGAGVDAGLEFDGLPMAEVERLSALVLQLVVGEGHFG